MECMGDEDKCGGQPLPGRPKLPCASVRAIRRAAKGIPYFLEYVEKKYYPANSYGYSPASCITLSAACTVGLSS
jgi:hypothetical protein